MQLEGKIALVTGGSRGIGRGIVEAFLKEGARVALSGRSQEKGEQALKELGAGDKAVFFASEESKYITGQVMRINGGQQMIG